MLQSLGLELPDDHPDGLLWVHFLALDAGCGRESFPWSSSSVSTEARGGMCWYSQNGRQSEEQGWAAAHTRYLPGVRPDRCGSPSKGLGAPEASLHPTAGPLNVHFKL